MITIANFSHPLSAEALEDIDRYHALNGGVREIVVAAQFDLTGDLVRQVREMVEQAVNQAGHKYDIDCFIPPALSFAAALLPPHLPRSHMIVMARDAGTPPRFMPVGLIRSVDLFGPG